MERNRKIGILLLILGIVLLGASICFVAVAENQKIQENTKVVGNYINGTEDLETYAKKIADAIEPLNPSVRAYALNAVNTESEGELNISQVCDVFDTLNNNWAYVEDPNGYDYFATASESVSLIKGDCDDFAILMASCIEAIGGDARVNIAYSSSGGHAYAEVYIGDNARTMNTVIEYIKERYGCDEVHYTTMTDEYGTTSYWLNLDWWEDHPGGTYFESVGEILAVHSDGTYYYYTLSRNNNNNYDRRNMPEYYMPDPWDRGRSIPFFFPF